MIHFILKVLEKTENSKLLKFLYFLFLPISYILELLCFKYFWNLIKNELLTNEEMVEFLSKNEFGYKRNKLYKIDIVEPDSFLNQFNVDELKLKIKQEISEIFIEKIGQITALDIENYLNILVVTDIVEGLKKYTVEIRYFRYYVVMSTIKYVFLWFIIVTGVLAYLKYFL